MGIRSLGLRWVVVRCILGIGLRMQRRSSACEVRLAVSSPRKLPCCGQQWSTWARMGTCAWTTWRCLGESSEIVSFPYLASPYEPALPLDGKLLSEAAGSATGQLIFNVVAWPPFK